jgi:hypothetical protein
VANEGDEGAWILNGKGGLRIPQLGILKARQHFRLVQAESRRRRNARDKFRVTTLSYLYDLRLNGGAEIHWHWHPGGTSKEQRPHMHLSSHPDAYLPCARHTLEDVVESCIELGAEPACADWQFRLDETRGAHNEHRSWTTWPRRVADMVRERD